MHKSRRISVYHNKKLFLRFWRHGLRKKFRWPGSVKNKDFEYSNKSLKPGGQNGGRLFQTGLALLLAFAMQNCTPTLNAVVPDTGYPRQLLALDGNVLFASLVWDIGLPTQQTITTGFLGTRFFQIPDGAAPGVHPVALTNSNGTSATVDVTVLAPSGNFPAPRMADIDIFNVGTGSPFDIALTVSAANLDTDATVTVAGYTVSVCYNWGGLPIDYLQQHIPATFAYPVYHYSQNICVVEGVNYGDSLAVTVTNHDGQSDSQTYEMPSSAANLDKDGDGLLDTWEMNGYPAPSGANINLPAMGADELRKTLLVEVDWVAAATPNATIWATIEAVFDDAPVLNPDGSAGIDLIIDRGQGGQLTGGGTVLADHTTMDFGANNSPGYVDFFTYKNNNFNNDRLLIFHYAIFGRARPNGSSGRGEVFGNDFMVTFANFANWPQDIAQVGTFVHEFGHNLGLSHGDLLTTPAQWNTTRKPNFPTTMSYRYQFPGVSVDCDFISEGIHTYSQGMMARITENNVNENIGICDNTPLDMNNDGNITVGAMDTSVDGDSTDTHDDFDQWHNMRLDFDAAGSSWNSN